MATLVKTITEKRIRQRIDDLVNEHGVALSAIALRSKVPQKTIEVLYNQKKPTKSKITKANAEKIENGLDAIEMSLGLSMRCSKCGIVKPLGRFYKNKSKPNGKADWCIPCSSKRNREYKKMNNNKDQAITAEIVKRVKEEDKRDIESKFMAPYFGIAPKQLDEIRRGIWDKLLVSPRQPKKAGTALEAIELLRAEQAELRREIEFIMLDMGIDVEKAKSQCK